MLLIGAREAVRASRDLRALIDEVLVAQRPDSPVYTFLPKLQQPRLSDEEFAELLDEKEAEQERLTSYMRAGDAASKSSLHSEAVKAYTAASHLKPNDPFIIQQLALATIVWKYLLIKGNIQGTYLRGEIRDTPRFSLVELNKLFNLYWRRRLCRIVPQGGASGTPFVYSHSLLVLVARRY